jgi:16S rRNA (adenine1518-N6/adenine1519-N6)-dimethyltransferase
MNHIKPRRTPIERLRSSGAVPDRSLGQNFLIDPNILNVIDRAAGLAENDVVLEVGPGVGVLTERLIKKCGRVYTIEVDRDLASLLQQEFSEASGLTIYRADAMNFDLGSLEPPPVKFVANLPYNIAAPLVLKSLKALPSLKLWCLMLQKEIADRLFARVGSREYGGISVLTQSAASKLSVRPVSSTVFYPQPRVRSSLLVFKRRRIFKAGDFNRLESVVQAAFSHRRKTLVNSMAGAPSIPEPLAAMKAGQIKEQITQALAQAGIPYSVRPQALSPDQYEQLTGCLWKLMG